MVRVRFAPSPTGKIHLGSARTALFNWVFARSQGGKFILRIEDSDISRSLPEFETDIISSLKWLGLVWDEGPDIKGDYGPYKQSERKELYLEHAKVLMEAGLAYRCFCTPQELGEMRAESRKSGKSPRYSGRCREMAAEEAERLIREGRSYAVRFRLPVRRLSFCDGIKGEVSIDLSAYGDFIIIKSDGTPTYNFASVIDDHLMRISHIIRGEDHLSNTALQLSIYDAFGWQYPSFYHLPMVIDEGGKKLSKRIGSFAIDELRSEGCLPDAIVNYLALLSWSHPQGTEIFSLTDMVSNFSFSRISKSSSSFNAERLQWVNFQHMKSLSVEDYLQRFKEYYSEYSHEALESIPAIRSDEELLSRFHSVISPETKNMLEAAKIFESVITRPDRDLTRSLLSQYDPTNTLLVLKETSNRIGELRELYLDNVRKAIADVAAKLSTKISSKKEIYHPLRIVLIGRATGLEVVSIVYILGAMETVARLSDAVASFLGKTGQN
ncbi:MAG: glutamate--tRNA ligase [Actinobacteria bacterium]|nr:glutamate--tRNA ligase [Actinomycetota bacterium]